MKVPTLGSLLALLWITSAGAEELVAFSSSAGSPADWRADGLTVLRTNGFLRFTLERDGVGRASVIPHLPALPDGCVRFFARGPGQLMIHGGAVTTNLTPAGWDEAVDFRLPAEPAVWQAELAVQGPAGTVCEVRELLVTGRLDMDPPLLQATGRQPERWAVADGAGFTAGGLRVRGQVTTRDDFVFTNRAVVALRVAEVAKVGLQVRAVAKSAEGGLLGEVGLGVANEAGLHIYSLDRAEWPAGTGRVAIRLQGAGGEGLVTELVVGGWPDA